MSAEVETMFSANGMTPWHGLGKIVQEAPTSHDALTLAGLDWRVNKHILVAKDEDGQELEVDNFYANVRSSDNKVLGVTGNRYRVVQNEDAFAFTDHLVHNDFGVEVKYETAGALKGGRRVWLSAQLPLRNVLGDDIVPYVVFVNNHDGKGSVRVVMTPTRVVCQNTLSLGLESATRSWSTPHTGNLEGKLEDAKNTLQLAMSYMDALEVDAEKLQQVAISNKQFEDILQELFPFNPFATGDKKNQNNLEARTLIADIYNQKMDLKPFRGSAWGVYNAMADYASHLEPKRKLSNFTSYKERRFETFIDGGNELNEMERLLRRFA